MAKTDQQDVKRQLTQRVEKWWGHSGNRNRSGINKLWIRLMREGIGARQILAVAGTGQAESRVTKPVDKDN